jgi:hypothetical protein
MTSLTRKDRSDMGTGVQYVNEAELAKALDLSRSTLRNWRREDKGPPFVRRGMQEVWYEVEAVLAWCKDNGVHIFNPFMEDADGLGK